jgi:hypothetical protein
MKNKIPAVVGIIILALLGIYIIYQDNLPPRTPQKVARLISGLSIPNSSRVVEFQDQWNNFNGNGFSFIVLQLDDQSFTKLYQESKDKGYKILPIIEKIYGPLKDISEKKTEGVYKVVIDDEAGMSFNGTMLSSDDKRVIVYFSVN